MDARMSAAFARAIDAEHTVALATIVTGPGAGRQLLLDARGGVVEGDLGSPGLNARAAALAADFLPTCRAAKVRTGGEDVERELFIEVHGPPPRLVVVGAVHVAVSLVHFARLLGFQTVVVDPRAVFAQAGRFAHADRLIVDWPAEAFRQVGLHDRTMMAVLSHDLKIDIPALAEALRHELPYIGALGSRKTQSRRVAALRDEGFTDEAIARIRSPIGFYLGSRRAEDVALGIAAEIVAASNGVAAGRPGPAAPAVTP